MNIVKGAKDPNTMLQSVAQQNPQLRNVMGYVQQSGGTAKDAFYKRAEQMGIDPNEILDILK